VYYPEVRDPLRTLFLGIPFVPLDRLRKTSLAKAQGQTRNEGRFGASPPQRLYFVRSARSGRRAAKYGLNVDGMAKPNQFVEDGHERASAALESVVCAEVQAEYASRLQDASAAKRMMLRIEIRREIRRRIDAQAPSDALYQFDPA